jgi:ribosomal protein L11 methyltransferase
LIYKCGLNSDCYLCKKNMSNIYGYHFTHSKGTNNSEEAKQLGSNTNCWIREKHLKVLPETETGISAFVQKDLWDETILEDIHILQSENLRLIIHSKKSSK